MLAFLALETQAEGIFKRLTKAGKGRELGLFYAKSRVVGVGGEKAGHVLRRGQRRIMEQHTLRYSSIRSPSLLRRRLTGMGGQLPEFALGLRQGERFQIARLSCRSFTDKSKSAEVGHKHHAIPLPVPLHLFGPGQPAKSSAGGLASITPREGF